MAWPVYSERFLIASVPGIWKVFEVPEDRRAIITSVLAYGLASETASVFAQAHGYTFLNHVFQAASSTVSIACRLPVYERESMQGLVYGAGTRLFISGYLFAAPGDSGPPATSLSRELLPEQLPTMVQR